MVGEVLSLEQEEGGKLVQDGCPHKEDDAEDVAHAIGGVGDGENSRSDDGLDNDSDGEGHVWVGDGVLALLLSATLTRTLCSPFSSPLS